MEILRAPWRGEYVTSAGSSQGCVMCDALARRATPDLLVHVSPLNFVMMNLYPYSSGHVMVAPKRHLASLAEATPEELAEMVMLARRLESILGELYRPDGINVGMNLGRAAGAGVADHIHLHLVPRWVGDANFMTAVGGTRVLPEDPLAACGRLRERFERGE
jgi:ATP adenylyltransferase